MPCPLAQLIVTFPGVGCPNWNRNVSGAKAVTLVAGWPLTSRSAASTPVTASVKTTSTWVSAPMVAPATGVVVRTEGATVSASVYVQDALAANGSNVRPARSVIPLSASKSTATSPGGGCENEKV